MGNRQTENWKDIPGYEGRYEVSDLGRVRNAVTKRMRKIYIGLDGTCSIVMSDRKKRTTTTVAKLVASSFLPQSPGDEEVMHIDSDNSNNAVTNLRWMSRSERMLLQGVTRGERNGNAKITAAEACEIRMLAETLTRKEIALLFKLTKSGVANIINKMTWRHV